jgi:AcrR family transcriptional regulator
LSHIWYGDRVTTAAKREETASAILALATQALADRPDATMAEIAAASGVGRATVYRCFPTRDVLMAALAADALQLLASRIGDAGRDDVTVPEAIARLARMFLEVSDSHVLLARHRAGIAGSDLATEMERAVWAPSRAIFQRGIDEGTFRRGLDPGLLSRSLAGLAVAAVDAGLPGTLGIDEASDVVATLFLNGATRRSKSKPKSKPKHAATA